ncbi:MAG: undecaprenyl-diphosphate phosphatase [Pseudomonadales bacterium]|nr:undecaprenyl-diphosphate phosphatase [Pseudomonadales bacterium]
MELLHIIALALIQGLTEFLPISSSAHLILPFEILGWEDQGLAFDTAVHLGSLFAVLVYFREDIIRLLGATWTATITQEHSADSKLAINLLIGSVPVIIAGLVFKDFVEGSLRSIEIIAFTTVFFGILLWIADLKGKQGFNEQGLDTRRALVIGVAQCFALVPGTSRSGVTMTAALMCGFDRESASRISFLLSIPAIAGAATLKTIDLVTGDTAIDWTSLSLGLVLSGVSAYICIKLFLDFINQLGFLPFVIYRFILGAALTGLIFFG